jgi:L-serine dehydratase
MNNLSAFDIIGPVMIGPSSSHTAGACRIGNLAKEIVDNKLKDVKIYFHGSFKETYRGHGTDKEGFSFEFFPVDLDDVHPNTMKLEITDQEDIKTPIVASSIGGGNIIVTELNGTEVKLKGEYYTLITFHNDQPGLIAKISEEKNILQLLRDIPGIQSLKLVKPLV